MTQGQSPVRPAPSSLRGRKPWTGSFGHGVLPETDPDLLGRLVELVHATTMVAA